MEEKAICYICMNDENNEQLIKCDCTIYFHNNCFKKWMQKKYENIKFSEYYHGLKNIEYVCPQCKKVIIKTDKKYENYILYVNKIYVNITILPMGLSLLFIVPTFISKLLNYFEYDMFSDLNMNKQDVLYYIFLLISFIILFFISIIMFIHNKDKIDKYIFKKQLNHMKKTLMEF
jgi:hypothetical protein